MLALDTERGVVKDQITKGRWEALNIEWIDEEKRLLYFSATGEAKGGIPYHWDLYKVGLDGKNLRLLTPEFADHYTTITAGKQYFIDTYSDIDKPPVSVLRRLDDGKLVRKLESADISQLDSMGWHRPKRIVAKGRDGKTDIYGVIKFPSFFQRGKTYPVIEEVYNAPYPNSETEHGFRFNDSDPLSNSLTELGFIVVSIQGFGTARRGVEFKYIDIDNPADSGLQDRKLWIKHVKTLYPEMDLDRLGLYGTSWGA